MKRKTKITRSRIRKCQTWLDVVAHVLRKQSHCKFKASTVYRQVPSQLDCTVRFVSNKQNKKELSNLYVKQKTEALSLVRDLLCMWWKWPCSDDGYLMGLPERDAPQPGDGHSSAEVTGVLASVVPRRLGEEFNTRDSLAYSELYLLLRCFPCRRWLRGRTVVSLFSCLYYSVDRGQRAVIKCLLCVFLSLSLHRPKKVRLSQRCLYRWAGV